MKKFYLGQLVLTTDGIGKYQYPLNMKGLLVHVVSFSPGKELMQEPLADDGIWVLGTYDDGEVEEVRQ